MRTRVLCKMINDEVQQYLKDNNRIIVPVGTTEMHGGFPLNCETVVSEAFALEMAKSCDALVLTGLPYFYAGATASGRGTVQVSVREGMDYLGALAKNLLRIGFRRQIYISFHGPAHMTICPMIRDFYDQTGIPILYIDLMIHCNKNKDLFENFADDFNSMIVGAYKIMGCLDDIPFVTGMSSAARQSCEEFSDLFSLGYQSSAIGYYFQRNSDHMPTPDIPDCKTRDRLAEHGQNLIEKLVQRLNMNEIAEKMEQMEEYSQENEALYPWVPSAWNRFGLTPNSFLNSLKKDE